MLEHVNKNNSTDNNNNYNNNEIKCTNVVQRKAFHFLEI